MLKTRLQVTSTHLYESRTPQMEAQDCHIVEMVSVGPLVVEEPKGRLTPVSSHVTAGTSWDQLVGRGCG